MRNRPPDVVAILTCVILGALWSEAFAGDWPRFRGPNGDGVSTDEAALPTTWSATENLKWKIALPGPGSSSPIVIGDRVFVTCWSGYGTERGDPGDQMNLRRHLICIDRETGNTIWSKTVEPYLPEDEYGGMFAQHGYASHTPVSDGKRIYVYFGKTGALAFDMEGNQLWKRQVGTESDPRGWGSASSPILYEDLLIVTASAESEAMVGLDAETGEEVWRQEAQGFGSTWGTPVLVPISEDRTDLVLGVPFEIWGINPDTGKLRWYCEAMDTDSFCSSVVTDGALVFAVEGRGGGSIAVMSGGDGDVTDSLVAWTGRHNGRISTSVIHDGKIYLISGGIAHCIDAATGESIYQTRLSGGSTPREQPDSAPGGRGGFGGRGGRGGFGGQDYSSPVIGDGKIFYVSRGGDVYVIKPGSEFEQLAVNRMTEDSEDFSATPAISDGHLLIRSSKHLYCVAQTP
jgi:outer membrane protein assembly factor BamB